MPLYAYACVDCGHEWEEVLSVADMDDPLERPCPECCSEHIIRCVGAPLISSKFGTINAKKSLPEDFKARMNQIRKEHPRGFKHTNFDY